MKLRSFACTLAGLVLPLIVAPTADASIITDVVDAEWSFLASPAIIEYSDSAIVGAGVEFTSNVPASTGFFDTADFLGLGGQTLVLSYVHSSSGTFSAKEWRFSDIDWVGQPGFITDILPDANNPLGALVTGIGADSFSISLPSLSVSSGSPVSWSFDIVAQHQSVPEPSSIALAGLGAIGLIGYRRRKRKQTV